MLDVELYTFKYRPLHNIPLPVWHVDIEKYYINTNDFLLLHSDYIIIILFRVMNLFPDNNHTGSSRYSKVANKARGNLNN